MGCPCPTCEMLRTIEKNADPTSMLDVQVFLKKNLKLTWNLDLASNVQACSPSV
jgi:hypothetical protein